MKRLLAIDDDPAIVEVLRVLAQRAGLDFCSARTVVEARELLQTAPELMVVDGMLPDGTGLELIAEVRSLYGGTTRVMFLSAYFRHFEAYARLQELGVSKVIHKPVSPEFLESELRELAGLDNRPEPIPEIQALLDGYRERLAERALELRAAGESWLAGHKPSGELTLLVHQIAGTAGTYGRGDVSEVAASLEAKLAAGASFAEAGALWRLLQEQMRGEERVETSGEPNAAVQILCGDATLGDKILSHLRSCEYSVSLLARGSDPEPGSVVIIEDTPGGDDSLGRIAGTNVVSAAIILSDDQNLESRVAGSTLPSALFLPRSASVVEIEMALRERMRPSFEGTTVLVVEDDPDMVALVRSLLEPHHITVRVAPDPQTFWTEMSEADPDLVLMDVNLPVYSGLELARVMKSDPRYLTKPIVFLTGSNEASIARMCLQLGADFVTKPVLPNKLERRLLSHLRSARMPASSRPDAQGLEGMVGASPAMGEVFRRVALAAQSDVTVLLSGESGTGKELAARALHRLSRRAAGPFVAINCGALPEQLLESELFGYVKGAFTGAVRDKTGLLESAEHGTLFLDEIETVTPALQVKLLRVLQEREFRRVGATQIHDIDVRIVAATNEDLRELVRNGNIRQDFYYRVRVFEITLPPLRERGDDVLLLIARLVPALAARHGKRVRGLSADAKLALTRHDWPGNVRELQNAIEHALVTVQGDTIELEHLPPELAARNVQPFRSPTRPQGVTDERADIIGALHSTGGNRTRAAQRLGYSRVTLWKKIRKYAIEEAELSEG